MIPTDGLLTALIVITMTLIFSIVTVLMGLLSLIIAVKKKCSFWRQPITGYALGALIITIMNAALAILLENAFRFPLSLHVTSRLDDISLPFAAISFVIGIVFAIFWNHRLCAQSCEFQQVRF